MTFVDNGNGTGTLSGTPDAGTGGAHAITFTATNSSGSTTQSFTLNVHQAPAITSAASTTFSIGAAGSFTVTTSGFPAATLAIGGAALPSGVQFVDNGDGTGTLSGTPAAGTGGTYVLTFTATNAAGQRASDLHADGEPGPDHHQPERDHLHRGERRHVHDHHDGLPAARDHGHWVRFPPALGSPTATAPRR